MSKGTHLVVIPAYYVSVRGNGWWEKEQRFVVKAGAPAWVDSGAKDSPATDNKGALIGFCSLPWLVTLGLRFGAAYHIATWAWVLDALLLVPATMLGLNLYKNRGERAKWAVELGSESAVELVAAVEDLHELSTKYALDEGMLAGWENSVLEAARELDPVGQELDSRKRELSGYGADRDTAQYTAALRERISDLESQITPIKDAATELVGQVKQLGYAKKAAELRGLSLRATPIQAAALSLLDEVDRVKALTAAYVELSALPENTAATSLPQSKER